MRSVLLQKQQDAAVKKAIVAMKHLEVEMTKAQKDAASKRSVDKQLQSELRSTRSAVDAAQRLHDGIHLDEAAVQHLEGVMQAERAAVQHWTAQRRDASASIGHFLDFTFRSPRQGFDRGAVRGVLARLVRVKDMRHSLALEVTAGAKLQHLVVNTEQVGALLHSLLAVGCCSGCTRVVGKKRTV
jgi:structural maintenance of chromosome 2